MSKATAAPPVPEQTLGAPALDLSALHRDAAGNPSAMLYRDFTGEVRAVNEDTREVEISFSSEQPYERWYGTEILCHDEGSVDLQRLIEVGSLLFHHGRDANYSYLPIGRIVKAEIDQTGKKGRATIAFDADEKSDLMYQKVKSGSLRGVSVGYRIGAIEEVKERNTSANGRFVGPCIVATKWTPFEISLEPTPADDSVGVGRSFELFSKGENLTMKNGVQTNQGTPETTPATPAVGGEESRGIATPAAPVAPLTPPVNVEAIRAEAAAAERSRLTEITALCRGFDIDPTEYLTSARSVEEVRADVLKHLQAERGAQAPLTASNVEVTMDDEDKFRMAARDGLLLRNSLPTGGKVVEGAREFQGMTMRSLAAMCLQRTGESGALSMDDEDLFRAVLGFSERSALAPDSSFVSILNDTMGAVISNGYRETNTTFEAWTGKNSNPNFKITKRFRLSAAGEILEIPQNGEFKADTVKDEGVDTQLKTYGKMFGFSRQAFINDDLGTIAKAILAQTRSCKRTINKKVYTLLGSASTQIDGKTLFSKDHKNLGTAAALSTTSLGELYTMMTLQKDISGNATLNVIPEFAIFPATLMLQAGRIISSSSDPDAPNSGVENPLKNKMKMIIEPELDGLSNTAFYVAANPNDVDTIEVAYLNGRNEPTLENRVSWSKLGIEWRIFLDFAVSLLDYRGLAKNAGK